jgi:uncharacterized protein
MMPKRVFIIHRWSGSPAADWYPWLKVELEKRGFEVHVPEMPDADHPKIETWVPFLAKQIGKLDEDTFLVGHSVGCQTILRFLESAKEKVGGCVFVGGWLPLKNLTADEKSVAKPWLETPINFEKVRKATKNSTAIFSDNDPYVPLNNMKLFEQNLGAKIVLESKKGHFTDEEGVKELPVVMNELLKLAK